MMGEERAMSQVMRMRGGCGYTQSGRPSAGAGVQQDRRNSDMQSGEFSKGSVCVPTGMNTDVRPSKL